MNGHSWKSRVAIMRARYLLGLSNANRQAAGIVTGDEVEVHAGTRARGAVGVVVLVASWLAQGNWRGGIRI
jgi:hypothetical protein